MGFTFNGQHSSTFGVAIKSKNRQLLPAVNDRYIEIPGRHGSFHFPGELQDRIIELECTFIGTSRQDLREKARQIAAWLYTVERAVLSFDDEPDKYYLAKVDNAIDLSQMFVLATFNLNFRCEPFAYGEEVKESFVGDAVTVTNSGTAETPPIFTATFTAAANEWKVTLGSKYVRVVRDFQVGDILEVNCATGAVLVNGMRSMFFLDWQNSEFFTLAPGNNDLTVLPAGVCATEIKWSPRWL